MNSPKSDKELDEWLDPCRRLGNGLERNERSADGIGNPGNLRPYRPRQTLRLRPRQSGNHKKRQKENHPTYYEPHGVRRTSYSFCRGCRRIRFTVRRQCVSELAG